MASSIHVREELRRLRQLQASPNKIDEKPNTELYLKGLGSLMLASDRNPVAFMHDLIDFEVTAIADRDERAAMLAVVALHISTVSKSKILEAVLPHLKRSDEPTRQVVRRLLQHIEDSSAGGHPDFSYYRGHIGGDRRDKREIDLNLVEHMFRTSPSEALRTFVMVWYHDERRKPPLWAAHVVDDLLWKRQHGFTAAKEPEPAVTQELEKMAKHDEWWARLYAAEVIRQHPELGNQSLVDELARDPHPLVQKTAKAAPPIPPADLSK